MGPESNPEPISDNFTVAEDMESDPGEVRTNSVVGRYIVLDSVGMGGMGLVCAAFDPKLNRKIALKLLRNAGGDAASTHGRNRLFREAQALARLSHPNVVTVHDVDVFEGQVYIAMEFVEGTTLRDWLREKQRTWPEILEKFVLAGRGLEAAHAAEIVHRDFKPANVLLSKDGDVRVADFGVAKEYDRSARAPRSVDVLDLERLRQTASGSGEHDPTAENALIEEMQSSADAELTAVGRMIGTPAYMAPEQHMGLTVGPYTDQYSFCVSLYEALYGRLPFEGVDRRDQLAKMNEGKLPPPPIREGVPSVPGWLHRVVARGLRPHPNERWPSMTELLAALSRDPARRWRRISLVAAGVFGLGLGALGLSLSRSDVEPVDPCADVGAQIHEQWNEERQQQVLAAFARSDKPFAADSGRRTILALDRWGEDWQEQRRGVCQATRVSGEQSERLLEVRMDCLDQALQDFTALVDVFAEADDDIVERAVTAAYGLRPPRMCATVKEAGEQPEGELDQATRDKLIAMDRDLDRARARARLSKFDESLPLQLRVVERARDLDDRRILMRALFDLSESQSETGDKPGCEESLREVIGLASTLGDADQEARAWSRLVYHVGYGQNRALEGRAWAFAERGAIVRAGGSAELWIRYDSANGALLYADGKYEEALEAFHSGLERSREELGEDDPQTLKLMVNYGIGLGALKRYDEAKKVLREAASRCKEVFGPTHPQLAAVYLNLGSAYDLGGEPERAEEALRAALEIREKIFGPDAPQLGRVLQALGNLTGKRRPADGLASLRRAAAIFSAHEGEYASELAVTLTNIGRIEQERGRYAEAQEAYDRVLTLYGRLYPDPHPKRVSLQDRRCDLFLLRLDWATAAETCQQAIAEGLVVGAPSRKAVMGSYEKLAQAERKRGRKAAADRAQAEAKKLALILEEEAKKAQNKDSGKEAAPSQ